MKTPPGTYDDLGALEEGCQVVWTNDFPNFRNGWFCVADGPYNRKVCQFGSQ
jgi:hypothetical protein